MTIKTDLTTENSSRGSVIFSPGYELLNKGNTLDFPKKLFFSIGLGLFYMLLVMYSLGENKKLFYEDSVWALAGIITVAMLSLYIATDSFRKIIPRMASPFLKLDFQTTIDRYLSDKVFLLSAIFFAFANLAMGFCFGIDKNYGDNSLAQAILYFGYFLAGFICGLAIGGIYGLCMIFSQYAPSLQKQLDFHEPDGRGGTEYLGNALIVFGAVTLVTGVFISVYIQGFDWDNRENKWVELLINFWIFFPYLAAFFVVSLPVVSIAGQLTDYKHQMRSVLLSRNKELRQECDIHLDKQQSSTPELAFMQERLADSEQELLLLNNMSVNPINRYAIQNAGLTLIPNLFATITTFIKGI